MCVQQLSTRINVVGASFISLSNGRANRAAGSHTNSQGF
jgi:hypothetical protein